MMDPRTVIESVARGGSYTITSEFVETTFKQYPAVTVSAEKNIRSMKFFVNFTCFGNEKWTILCMPMHSASIESKTSEIMETIKINDQDTETSLEEQLIGLSTVINNSGGREIAEGIKMIRFDVDIENKGLTYMYQLINVNKEDMSKELLESTMTKETIIEDMKEEMRTSGMVTLPCMQQGYTFKCIYVDKDLKSITEIIINPEDYKHLLN